MAAPLPLSYQWRTPVVVSSVGAILFCSLMVRSRAPGWVSVIIVVLVLWVAFLGVVWLRCRAHLALDGSRLTVRRFRRFVTVDGAQVRTVTEYLTANGPSYRLRLDDRDDVVHVPTALLRGGHTSFFGWLAAHAPRAELDRGARRTRDRLLQRGLLDR